MTRSRKREKEREKKEGTWQRIMRRLLKENIFFFVSKKCVCAWMF
tara:strand:- start:3088 stop:3222 length:135 start_codon:yes stop_codon:yes gene_type:complete